MKPYTTVLNYGKFEYTDHKSVFIGEILPVKSEQDALDFITSVKRTYPDAKHHVYSYVLRENSTTRFSDDREPQGTAGLPVLEVIKKRGCTDVCVVVTRYFGGILLGTGGLARAYTSAANGAIECAHVITYDIYSNMEIDVTYSDYQKITSALKKFLFRTENTKYGTNVIICGRVLKSALLAFCEEIMQITNGRANTVIYSETFDY